jgi:hypothetical protein
MATAPQQSTVARWHALVEGRNLAGLDDVIADGAVFHSPVVHTPQEGKAITIFYLTAAFHVLLDQGFRYVREVVGPRDAVLEFVAEIDGIHVNGVDMIHWNADGKIDDFKVMVRPMKAINLLFRLMGEKLQQLKSAQG